MFNRLVCRYVGVFNPEYLSYKETLGLRFALILTVVIFHAALFFDFVYSGNIGFLAVSMFFFFLHMV